MTFRFISQVRFPKVITLIALAALAGAWGVRAEDWPEWRGKGRGGVWRESGILDTFPAEGLKLKWRTPIGGGYAGPAVSNGHVFVTDFNETGPRRGIERALCLNEGTGKILWTREWPVDYAGLDYAYGPRATPTVDGNRVYVLGTKGMLLCLKVRTGKVIWKKDYVKDYGIDVPIWGTVAAPLVDGNRLICLVGGEPDAKVVAFDKMTGKEIWRALPSDSEPGYAAPILIEAGGKRQVIIWHPEAVSSLDPETGKVYWEHPFKVNNGVTVATPVFSRNRLLISAFYNGSRLLRLHPTRPAAELVWKGESASEIKTDGLHSLITTPVIQGDYLYGIGSYGQFRCLDARTGERVWETLEVTREKARWAAGLIVRHQDRFFINNDRGELILARLSPKGYQEISRTQLIKPTTRVGRRRELGLVNWSHPAYANRHLIIRNDEEIRRYSLVKE